ncbi:ABC transporter substrate-binding protein [Streptomyces sp. NPDC059639]|uniref:ABC transporter substrate-binding protein n=1 Tax=Streptomyces sp. NPDC059639 TaxID=3346891 RepID=UPI00369961EB
MTTLTTTPRRRKAVGNALRARLCRLLAPFALLVGLTACAGSGEQHVTVMVPWDGQDEFGAFYSVVKDFEHDTGIKVDVQVTRALTQQLDAAVTADAPPDLAVLPSPAAIARYVQDGAKRAAVLQPFDEKTVDIGAYLEPFQGLGQVGGATYAVPVKIDVKSLVWYDTETTDKPRTRSTDALSSFAREGGLGWCLGLASGPTSGWPGADWIADIVLADAGTDVYARWASGRLPWTTTAIERAWTRWRALVGAPTLKKASDNGFTKATQAMADPKPGCRLAHGARSALAAELQKEPRFDFVAPSAHAPLEVSGDFIGMFTDDNPAARTFVHYLSGAQAQQTWVDAAGSSAFSARAEGIGYRNAVQQRIAALLEPASGHPLCFGAADLMSPDVVAAFYRAVLDYAGGDGDAKTLMSHLQQVQPSPDGTDQVPRDDICSDPT